jgi:hypothetical protein
MNITEVSRSTLRSRRIFLEIPQEGSEPMENTKVTGNVVCLEMEAVVLSTALAYPSLAPHRLAELIPEIYGRQVQPAAIKKVLRKHKLVSFRMRVVAASEFAKQDHQPARRSSKRPHSSEQ